MLGRVANLLCSISVLGEVQFLAGAGGSHWLSGWTWFLMDLTGALELDEAAWLVSSVAQALLYCYVLHRVTNLEKVECDGLGYKIRQCHCPRIEDSRAVLMGLFF